MIDLNFSSVMLLMPLCFVAYFENSSMVISINDYDVVSTINMMCKIGFILTK